MQLEKDQTALDVEGAARSAGDSQDEAIEWLLDMDLSDPVESLFTVENEVPQAGLTEYEAEMAGRPMFRGHGGGDDISAILDDEIIATEVGGESDIYALSSLGDVQEPVSDEDVEPLTIEHSNHHNDVMAATSEITVADGEDILSLGDDDDMGDHFLVLVNSQPRAEEPSAAVQQEPQMVVPEPVADAAIDLDLELDLTQVDPLDPGLEAEVEADVEPETTADPEPESVVDYIASVPAPVDEAEFDQYLLAGHRLVGADEHPNSLEVERTEGVATVDPEMDGSIDYHEDFQMRDGVKGKTVSVITRVIAQVMEEMTASVEQRMTALGVDPRPAQVEVMLGNDVESIIECVTDGYAPIGEIQPELPATLRQLGQTEVDALYVRISHDEIKGAWNKLFDDDFLVPGSDSAPNSPEVGEQSQPFAEFDLDEFDFGEADATGIDDFSAQDFGDELALYSSSSGDDPLSAIDFAMVDEHAVEQANTAQIKSEFSVGSDAVARDVTAIDAAEKDALSGDGSVESWYLPAGISFSSPTEGSVELFVDFLDVFIEEGTAELEKLEDGIARWEAAGDCATPAVVSHTLHTLKGIAKGVGLHCFGTLVHNYETLLEGLPQLGDENEKVSYFQIVNVWLDAVVQGLETIEDSREDIDYALPKNTNKPVQSVPTGQSGDEVQGADTKAEPAISVAIAEKPKAPELKINAVASVKPSTQRQSDKQLADEGAKTLAAQQSIRMSAESLDKLLNLTNQAQQLGVRSSESAVRSKLAAAESLARLSSVRAHIVKIADRALSNVSAKGDRSASEMDALEMDQYSELQEAANILRESVEDLDDLIHLSARQISMAEALLKQQAAVISSLGASIQEARVVPMSRLIPGLRRIVRTVGADLGKTVSFKVLNQVGTLDRDNHARCQVILEHMVRNAMDHGIESPQQRLAQGKPETGLISIDINKRGADYIITLADDGRGVDPTLMRETAYNRGLDVDVDSLSDDEAIRLIFHKGFTTATTVTELSGRGVGMDIVLSELQEIGGDIEIESVVGEGTRFHIRIPPNVSVNGALLVSAGEHAYAIPLDGLIAVDYVDVDKFFEAASQKSTLSLFGVEAEPAYLATICHGESMPERATWPKSVPVLIAGSQDRYMAIAVDDVKQALELVIRSLGVQFSAVPGVAGATTTADGQAVVALDLNALVASAVSAEHTPVSLSREVVEQLLVLVVDDSRTQRMVSTSQFDTLGVETITAENGMVAIDLLNTTHRLPDVILLDVEMPVKDGIQTLREIRKSVRYSHIPVIMVTSRTGAKHRALADEAGCDGYMGKPFNFPVLVEQISELTGHKLELS